MVEFVRGFEGEYRFLSNFYPAEVEFDGDIYATTEAAFQAAKFDDLGYRKQIRNAESPGEAKRLGRTRNYPLRDGWNDGLAILVMAELNAKKFEDLGLQKRLLATGDAVLVETNDWGDDIWGDSTTTRNPGKNQLGIILMSVRASIRASLLN